MKKKIIIALLAVLIIVPGALYYMGYIPIGGGGGDHGEGGEEEVAVEYDSHGNPIPVGEALYFPLNPPFVVNFTHLGILRYLQISLEVMYKEQEFIDRIEMNMPAIRNELIMLLSNQSYDRLSSLDGKQEIRHEISVAINDIILHEEDPTDLGEIYITNFVMQ